MDEVPRRCVYLFQRNGKSQARGQPCGKQATVAKDGKTFCLRHYKMYLVKSEQQKIPLPEDIEIKQEPEEEVTVLSLGTVEKKPPPPVHKKRARTPSDDSDSSTDSSSDSDDSDDGRPFKRVKENVWNKDSVAEIMYKAITGKRKSF
jgi:hypothetical protein